MIEMLESTFIHCPGVGIKKEQLLWEQGALNWSLFLQGEGRKALNSSFDQQAEIRVRESCERLENEDYAWFSKLLPAREQWRAWSSFRHRVAFLDIETTGGFSSDDLTVIGVYNGREVRQYVKGQNLGDFPEDIEYAALLVTFFGTGFDLPFLRRAYGIHFPQIHIDLCYLLKRLGYSGGLKNVEKRLGIQREDDILGMDGMDAIRLWNEWQRGNRRSGDLLLEYNRADIMGLETLMGIAWPLMIQKSGYPLATTG